MFEKKRCGNCGESVKTEYNYCPSCGESLSGRKSRVTTIFSPFRNVFEDIDREFERIDKNFGTDYFKKPHFAFKFPGGTGGISITVLSGTGMRPKVDVKTYGQYKHVEPEIRKKLGVGTSGSLVEQKEEPSYQKAGIPMITEEPQTDVRTMGSRQVITVKLPDVKSEGDIDIKKLEQSVEIKAIAGDKAYFKLIPIKGRIIGSKKFDNGVLTLEIVK